MKGLFFDSLFVALNNGAVLDSGKVSGRDDDCILLVVFLSVVSDFAKFFNSDDSSASGGRLRLLCSEQRLVDKGVLA